MDSSKNSLIFVPLEFKVACTINKVNISEVLQAFIDHVFLYDDLSGEYAEGYTEATKTILACVGSRERQRISNKSFADCKDIAVKCIKEILELSKRRDAQPHQNRKKSSVQINMLYKSMRHFYAPSTKIFIDPYTSLKLSKNFCIFCEMHSCLPNEYLEYFMANISLADAHARTALKIFAQNLPLASFTTIVNYIRKAGPDSLPVNEIEIDFYQKAKALRLSLFIIRNLEERTRILKAFYLTHYQKMNP